MQTLIIAREYAPYNLYAAFEQGFNAYNADRNVNPYRQDSVDAQAWDRGAECASRVARWNDQNVGSN